MQTELIKTDTFIRSRIYSARGVQVMLDSDLSELYGVEVKRLTEQVKRNIDRFPEQFHFQLTSSEYNNLRSQIATSRNAVGHGGRRYLPYVFTEQGVAMLSAVLRSETAIAVSIRIMDAFVEMRHFLAANNSLYARMDNIEKWKISVDTHNVHTDQRFEKLFKALEAAELPQQGVFFDGQIYDAYAFASNLIRKAKKSLILIDNYIDDSVLTIFSKRGKGVSAILFTQKLTKQLALDLAKFNTQYEPIEIKETTRQIHDRFLIIDDTEIYHIGASLKDLGKKMFAFSRLELPLEAIMRGIEER